MAVLFKSSDIALKDFYFDLCRRTVVSTKRPKEKDLKWRHLYGRPGLFVQLLNGTKVIKTIRRENVNKVFDVLITTATRNDMPYKNSPKNILVRPHRTVTTAIEKEAVYNVCKVTASHLALSIVETRRTLKTAQDSAESWAKHNPGTRYAVIQIYGKVTVGSPVWE